MLTRTVVVVCLLFARFDDVRSARRLRTVASPSNPRNISRKNENNGAQGQGSLENRHKYTEVDLEIGQRDNINVSRHSSSRLYPEAQDSFTVEEYHTESNQSSNVFMFEDSSTKDKITDAKPDNKPQQQKNKSKGNTIPVTRVEEATTDRSNQNNSTTESSDKRYKRDKSKTKSTIQASSNPGSTAIPDLVKTYQDANTRLRTYILNQQHSIYRLVPYNINNKCPANTSGIFLKFTPFRILSVDEVQQSISISCYMSVRWYDNSFSWDPPEFGNINVTLIKSTRFWTPTIVLPTSTGHGLYLDTTDYLQITPKLSPRGVTFIMKFPFQFTVQCDLDMFRYPFDQQKCVIIFRELNQNPLLPLKSKEADFEMAKSLHTSGEWEILEWQNLDSVEGEPFTLRWRITLRRQSKFFVANLLIPLVQTSLMTLLVFWIPAESGEKMSFVVSMFVSTSVFLFTINDEMPRSIRQLPTINVVVVAVTSEIILVAMASLYVLRRYKYLQKIKNANPSLKFATELGHMPRDSKEVHANLSGHQNPNHLTHKQSTIEYVKSQYQPPEALAGNYGIGNNSLAARIDKSDNSAKMTLKFGFSDNDKNRVKVWGDGLYSHETLDSIFFYVFVLVNVIGGIFAYLSWF